MRAVTLAPLNGWSAYSKHSELLDCAFDLHHSRSWHYLNLTSTTMVFEAPCGSLIYFEVVGDRINQAVVQYSGREDAAFTDTVRDIVDRFALHDSPDA